ncbi:MAG: class GN sortase [Gammaproteobacteria bacterium]|nr:MAG: class GN sortase [Gammaproteobacteria bacterium]
MKKNKTKLIIGALLLLSVGLFGNTIYIHSKAILAQYLIANAWQQTKDDNQHSQTLKKPSKPWGWADTYPVAKLIVPKENLHYYVLAGATGSPLAFAPGLYAGTALPGIAPNTDDTPDTVIAGHHNTHFAFLQRIKIGDIIQLENHLDKTVSYRVSDIKTPDIRRQQLPAHFGGNSLTLVTCSPGFAGEIHPNRRLVVVAEKINSGRMNRHYANIAR